MDISNECEYLDKDEYEQWITRFKSSNLTIIKLKQTGCWCVINVIVFRSIHVHVIQQVIWRTNERNKYQPINSFYSHFFLLLSFSLCSPLFIESIYIYVCMCIRPSTSIIHIFFSIGLPYSLRRQMTRTSTSRMESTKKTKSNLTKIELKKLKSILPTLQQKPSSTPIEIVLETIRYIRQLEDQLIDRFHTGMK